MANNISLVEIIEDLRRYFLERENKNTNIFLFMENKSPTKEFCSGLLYKSIDYLRILLLFFLNLFLIILLVIHTKKYEKDKNDDLTTLLLIISLILSITIILVLLRYLKFGRIKKKNLLYLLYAFNFIISCLLFYFNISYQTIGSKRILIYSKIFNENIFDISFDLDIQGNKKNNESGEIITNYNVNTSFINQTDEITHFKFLQIGEKNETLKNITFSSQTIMNNHQQEKKEIYIIFNIAQYLLFFFICLGEKRILIFSFVFNLFANIIVYFLGFIVNLNFLFFLIITDVIMLLVLGINQLLLNILIKYINLHFSEIMILLEYFLSLFSNFGIFYNILIEDNNINNEQIDKYKSISQIRNDDFQKLSKKRTFKGTAIKNMKENNKKSKNNEKEVENNFNNQTNQYLINEISPSSLKLSEENRGYEKSTKIKQIANDFSNIDNFTNTNINEKTNYHTKNNDKKQKFFNESRKLNHDEEFSLAKQNSIKNANDEFSNLNQQKINFDPQQQVIKNKFEEKNFSKRKLNKITNLDEKENNANKQIEQEIISSNNKKNSDIAIEAISISQNNFMREEETFNPCLLFSNFYRAFKNNNENSDNSNSLQKEIYKVHDLINSNFNLDEKLNIELKDLINFNFEKFVHVNDKKTEESKSSSNFSYNLQRFKFSENSLKPFSSCFSYLNSDENESNKKKFNKNYINNNENNQIYNGTNESNIYNYPIENWVNNSNQNINIFHNNLKSPELKMKNPIKIIENTSDKIQNIKIFSNPLYNKNLFFSSPRKNPIQINYKKNFNIQNSTNLKNSQLWEYQNNEIITSMNLLEESFSVSEFNTENIEKDNLNDYINNKPINIQYNSLNLSHLNNNNKNNSKNLFDSKYNCNFTLKNNDNKIPEIKNSKLYYDCDLGYKESLISNNEFLKSSLYCKVKNEHDNCITPRIENPIDKIYHKFDSKLCLTKNHRLLFLKKKSFSASPLKTLFDNKNIIIKNSMIEGNKLLNNNYLNKKTRTIDSQHLHKINSIKESRIYNPFLKYGNININSNKKLYNTNIKQKHFFLEKPYLKMDERKFSLRQFKNSDSYEFNDLESCIEENFEIKTQNSQKSEFNKNSLSPKSVSVDKNINFICNNKYLIDKKDTLLIDHDFISKNLHFMNEKNNNKFFKNNLYKNSKIESIKENEYFNFKNFQNNQKNNDKDIDKKDKANYFNIKENLNWEEKKRISNPHKCLNLNSKDNQKTLHEILKKLIHTIDKSKILSKDFQNFYNPIYNFI